MDNTLGVQGNDLSPIVSVMFLCVYLLSAPAAEPPLSAPWGAPHSCGQGLPERTLVNAKILKNISAIFPTVLQVPWLPGIKAHSVVLG